MDAWNAWNAWLDALWKPALGGFVLCTGLLVTIVTRGRLFRGLAQLAHKDARQDAAVVFATSASVTSISAGVGAVAVGGPGALVWMWIVAGLGLALTCAESRTLPTAAGNGRARPPRAWLVAAWTVLAFIAGGLWQGVQARALLEVVPAVPTTLAPVAITVALASLAAFPRIRSVALLAVPIAAAVGFAGICLAVLLEDPLRAQLAIGDAVQHAFGLQAAAAGTVGGAIAAALSRGALAAVLASNIGVGAYSSASRVPALWLSPIVIVGLLATPAALVYLTNPPKIEVASRILYPLEVHESRGLQPNPDYGQLIVLPEHTEYASGKHYAMVLRADPRGHKLARPLAEEDSYVVPAWDIVSNITVIRFRAKEPHLARRAAWDIEVPCTIERFGGQGGAPEFIRLRPQDPDLSFKQLIAFYELDPKPYINAKDFSFVGSVSTAHSPDESLGEHLVMLEQRESTAPYNPKLHELFRYGFRGPYPDAESSTDEIPWALISQPGFSARNGQIRSLQLRADARGVDTLRVNRVGTLEAPPWPAMLDVREVIIRHQQGQDIRVPVAPRLDGKRVRLDALDPKWEDFRSIASNPQLSGPYAVLEDVRFDVEVHGDARLPSKFKGRHALVPLHGDLVPKGPQARELYEPHPHELIAAGYEGPFTPDETTLVARIRQRASAPVVAIIILLLASTTTFGWLLLLFKPLRAHVDPVAAKVYSVALLLAPALGCAAAPRLFPTSWIGGSAMLLTSAIVIPVLVHIIIGSKDSAERTSEQ